RAEHLIFVLADSLGIQFIDQLPRGSWLRRHTRRSILAPYPPTTPVALTTVATGEYPACHAITGWWTHLPSLNAPVTVFHNARSTDEVSLDDLGVPFAELCPRAALMPRMQRDVALVMPAGIADTPFTRYMAGGRPCLGYTRHAEAAQKIAARIQQASGPTYTYWYTPYPDTLAHEHGTRDERVMGSVEDLDDAVGALVRMLREHDIVARIVITADHGHLDVGGAGHLEVTADDPLLAYLACPPSGDVRTQFWHVKPGMHHEFKTAFKQRFGEWFLLLKATDTEVLGLFGPDLLSEATRDRIGDFVSVSLGREVLRYTGAPGREKYLAQRSHHSGLSAAEMHVPLIIVPTETTAAERELDFTARRRG
ncbi:MAG: alkaline phosphatase family protein, partial [Dehalococcoidia bacterium]